MPRPHAAADVERDQQLLSQLPRGGSPDEVAAAVVQVKAQREKEMADRVSAEHQGSVGPSAPSLSSAEAASATLSGSHRAKITIGRKAVPSPLSAELPRGGSPDEVAAAVVQVKAQREKEMADRVSAEHQGSVGPSAPSL